MKSRYREGISDYAHDFHAGNIGDVLKHCVLRAWVRALSGLQPTHFIDTHAGAGMYQLPPSGEWDAGVGRLDALPKADAPAPVRDYLEAIGDRRRPNKGGLYPGSPALIRGAMGERDRLTLVELAEAPHAKLAAFYTDDAAVEVEAGDGFAAATADVDRARAVFIDPPYSQKSDWQKVAECVLGVRERDPKAAVLVWYPIKSMKRPHTLAAAVRDAGPGVSLELISTPLAQSRKALNGSGLLLVQPPSGLVEGIGAALPWLGAALAHPDYGEWTARTRGWA